MGVGDVDVATRWALTADEVLAARRAVGHLKEGREGGCCGR